MRKGEKMGRIKDINELGTLREKIIKGRSPRLTSIVTSSGTCGQARGSEKVVEAFKEIIKKEKLSNKIDLRITGCHGFCEV
ncbi:MAG: (2Fe-2S) ferredoxin domain-containing protein, partial [Thermoplasmata archaeon]|nr:(2Fe-2S) ferredoxin domain-containing protein [Thermoplasmata archaeon]